MIKKKVPLDEIEKKLLQIAYTSNEKILNQKFDWKSFFIFLIIALLSLYVLLLHQGFGIQWLFFAAILITFVALYKMLIDYPTEKKAAVFQKEKLSKLINLEEVEIYECSCNKALHLFDDHLEGSFYIFEVKNNKCVAYLDYYNEMNALLPNSKFSFFVDSDLSAILGDHLKVFGDRFVPYKFHDGKPFWGEKNFPQHLEIMNCSLEAYLDGISLE